jgi:acetylcholinesterase
MSIYPLPRPRITLRQGMVIGIEVEGQCSQVLEEFVGAPYAIPPVGERRFRPPIRVNASTDAFDAEKSGYRRLAGPPRERNSPQHEDCLNLNIYRPKVRNESRKLGQSSFSFGAGNKRAIDPSSKYIQTRL